MERRVNQLTGWEEGDFGSKTSQFMCNEIHWPSLSGIILIRLSTGHFDVLVPSSGQGQHEGTRISGIEIKLVRHRTWRSSEIRFCPHSRTLKASWIVSWYRLRFCHRWAFKGHQIPHWTFWADEKEFPNQSAVPSLPKAASSHESHGGHGSSLSPKWC
jgi:hypothetical protein